MNSKQQVKELHFESRLIEAIQWRLCWVFAGEQKACEESEFLHCLDDAGYALYKARKHLYEAIQLKGGLGCLTSKTSAPNAE